MMFILLIFAPINAPKTMAITNHTKNNKSRLKSSFGLFLNFDTKTPILIKHYPLGGPGNQLLKVNQDAYLDTINFIIK